MAQVTNECITCQWIQKREEAIKAGPTITGLAELTQRRIDHLQKFHRGGTS